MTQTICDNIMLIYGGNIIVLMAQAVREKKRFTWTNMCNQEHIKGTHFRNRLHSEVDVKY